MTWLLLDFCTNFTTRLSEYSQNRKGHENTPENGQS